MSALAVMYMGNNTHKPRTMYNYLR